jgi:hypothetical protein
MRARLLAIVVELGLEVVERLTVLRPFGLHRHCPEMALAKDVIGADHAPLAAALKLNHVPPLIK